MSYFLLRQRRIVDEDGEDRDAVEFTCDDDRVCDLPWRMGVRFKKPPTEHIVLVPEDDGDLVFRDYLSTPVPLISDRLRAALQVAGAANVEYYDTRVIGTVRYPDSPVYVAMNVIGLVEVVDESQSASRRAFGVKGADLFDKLVIRKALSTELCIFRMAEQTSTLIVSEAVKKACETLGVDTVDFMPLSM